MSTTLNRRPRTRRPKCRKAAVTLVVAPEWAQILAQLQMRRNEGAFAATVDLVELRVVGVTSREVFGVAQPAEV